MVRVYTSGSEHSQYSGGLGCPFCWFCGSSRRVAQSLGGWGACDGGGAAAAADDDRRRTADGGCPSILSWFPLEQFRSSNAATSGRDQFYSIACTHVRAWSYSLYCQASVYAYTHILPKIANFKSQRHYSCLGCQRKPYQS